MPVLGIEVAHDFAVVDGTRAHRGAAHTGEGSLQRRSARARAPAEHHDGRVVVLVVLLRQAGGCCSGCGAAREVVVSVHRALMRSLRITLVGFYSREFGLVWKVTPGIPSQEVSRT